MLERLIKSENIILNLEARTKDAMLDEMIAKLNQNGYLKNAKKFKKDVLAREEEGNTGIGFGFGIPHAKSKQVKKCCIAIGVSQAGIAYDAFDEKPVHYVFLLAIEEKESQLHLQALATLSRKFMHNSFRESLAHAKTVEEIYQLVLIET